MPAQVRRDGRTTPEPLGRRVHGSLQHRAAAHGNRTSRADGFDWYNVEVAAGGGTTRPSQVQNEAGWHVDDLPESCGMNHRVLEQRASAASRYARLRSGPRTGDGADKIKSSHTEWLGENRQVTTSFNTPSQLLDDFHLCTTLTFRMPDSTADMNIIYRGVV